MAEIIAALFLYKQLLFSRIEGSNTGIIDPRSFSEIPHFDRAVLASRKKSAIIIRKFQMGNGTPMGLDPGNQVAGSNIPQLDEAILCAKNKELVASQKRNRGGSRSALRRLNKKFGIREGKYGEAAILVSDHNRVILG